MRLSEVASKLGFSYWYPVDKAIKQIYSGTKFNIKESNNKYHIDIGIKQPEHRYSVEAIALFDKAIKGLNYSIFNEIGEEVNIIKDNLSEKQTV